MLGCSRSKTGRMPDGKFVGPSHLLGHKLRDGLRVEPAKDAWKTVDIAIVGGGVSGLAAAWKLKREGFNNFVLFEIEANPGGTAQSGTNSFISYPWGAHYLPVPQKENQELLSLLDEMNLLEGRDQTGEPIVAEQFLCRDPEERVFFRGRWYEGLYLRVGASQNDLEQFENFQKEIDYWVAWRDNKGRKAFTIPVANSSDDAEVTALDKLSIAQYLSKKGFNSSRLLWYIDYACRDDYGTRLEDTSAWAAIFYFTSRMKEPRQQAQPLITWPEGNGKLISHLYNRVKDNVRLSTTVTDIVAVDKEKGGHIDVTTLNSLTEEAFGFHAKKVIFAAPHFLTKYMLRHYKEATPNYLSNFDYGSWMVANLTLRDRPSSTGFPLCWDNVLYESPSLGYVVATHQAGIDRGQTVFTYYYPLCDTDTRKARNRLLSINWDEWADVILTDLSRAHPDIRDLVDRIDIMRWGHAMIRPKPGFIWSGSLQQASQPSKGIHFATSDLSGVALFEEAFYHGTRAAREVLTSLADYSL